MDVELALTSSQAVLRTSFLEGLFAGMGFLKIHSTDETSTRLARCMYAKNKIMKSDQRARETKRKKHCALSLQSLRFQLTQTLRAFTTVTALSTHARTQQDEQAKTKARNQIAAQTSDVDYGHPPSSNVLFPACVREC